jgi:hypothetical protein
MLTITYSEAIVEALLIAAALSTNLNRETDIDEVELMEIPLKVTVSAVKAETLLMEAEA